MNQLNLLQSVKALSPGLDMSNISFMVNQQPVAGEEVTDTPIWLLRRISLNMLIHWHTKME